MTQSRTWSVGYVHRALQLARDEQVADEQVTEIRQTVEWLLATPEDAQAVIAGAADAPCDVRRLPPDGRQEWVLLTSGNYRRAMQLLTMQTTKGEKLRLLEGFSGLLRHAPRPITGAHALVARIERDWRLSAPSEALPPAPLLPAPLDFIPLVLAEAGPPGDPAGDLSITGALPLPDPSWLELFARFQPGRVAKGSGSDPQSPSFRQRETWIRIADWMEALTATTLGDGWTGARHSNWQNSGHLSSAYWAKLYPVGSRFADMFHVGVQFTADQSKIPLEEFDPAYIDFANRPVIAVWASANENLWRKVEVTEPEVVAEGMRHYDRIQLEAIRTNPELWLARGAGWRWRRKGGRGADAHTGSDLNMRASGRHVLTPMLSYLDGVAQGRYPRSGHIFGPLITIEDAMRDPVRATDLIAASMRVISSLVASTYQAMEQVNSQ